MPSTSAYFGESFAICVGKMPTRQPAGSLRYSFKTTSMRALQILVIISFCIFVLVVPYLVFSFIQEQGSNTALVVLIAVIFVVNALLIGRKLLSLKKDKK